MDPSRFVLPPSRWDTNSALRNYNAAREAEFRFGGGFGGRGFPEGKFSRETIFPREPFHREILLEREGFPVPPSATGLWPTPRRRSLEEELAFIRGSQRHEKVGFVDSYREADAFRGDVGNIRDPDNLREINSYTDLDGFRDYREPDEYRDYSLNRTNRYGAHTRDSYDGDDYEYEYDYDHDYRHRVRSNSREGSRDVDRDYSRHSDYDSEHERKRRDRSSRRHRDRERERRGRSRERERSPERERRRERSRSYSHDEWDRKSHSPRSSSRSKREGSHEEGWHESRSEKRDRDGKRYHDRAAVAPSATLVVKGLSQKTVEDDLYQALSEWGPLRHVRVIRERGSGISRGFAFVDFPSVEAARKMMEDLGDDGLVLDGRRLLFEYSSKPTGGVGAPQSLPTSGISRSGASATGLAAVDWVCTICGCVNFARRTSCFQCSEVRADDAPPADGPVSSASSTGRKGLEAGPTHVLVVRGLDEHVSEETLHYEFSKYAPIKDLRLIRDKFTQISRGFAFVHFNTVEEATKALEASNGTTLEKNGQVLRVAYAKSIYGPNSCSGNASSLAAAAIEAAAFSQQYDATGWISKDHVENAQGVPSTGNAAPQSGFVWDEASGYYYDAASGFYYDGHRGLYYDGNTGVWYTYNQDTQQYEPYVESSGAEVTTENMVDTANAPNGINALEKINDEAGGNSISEAAPATEHEEKKPSLAEAVQAAALAAQAAAKKDRERMKEKEKEIRLASKNTLLAYKKRINNAVNLWKQRQQEGQAVGENLSTPVSTLLRDEKQENNSVLSGSVSAMVSTQNHAIAKRLEGVTYSGRSTISGQVATGNLSGENQSLSESTRSTPSATVHTSTVSAKEIGRVDVTTGSATQPASTEGRNNQTPFKTDASALGSYGPMAGAKRRFTEAPQPMYRDRAAERRSLYGSSSAYDDTLDLDRGTGTRSRGLEMPFPPGVGSKGTGVITASALAGPEVQSFEVITADRAIDEKNVGNRMLRNMGWQEGSGLGKDGSGIVEPVRALTTDERAGLGSQHHKVDARFETQPGDSYRTVIQKKALARFHEMI